MTILLVAGEPSGEKHAASLVRYLTSQKPDLKFYGIGGDLMKNAGVELLFHVNQTSVMGFFEVLKHLSFFKHVKKTLTQSLDQRKPDVVILVDYPGFNLRFAKEVFQRQIPIYYYISPQIWAWGKGRIKEIKQMVKHMLVILPFEKDFYEKSQVRVTYVGHPLVEQLKCDRTQTEFFSHYQLKENVHLVALLPGSRQQEIKSLLPDMLDAVKPLLDSGKIQVIIGGVTSVPNTLYDMAAKYHIPVIFNDTQHIMKFADQAVVASGTATLETALCGTPLTVVYKTSWLTYLLGKYLVKLDRISLVNIISNEMIVPELIQHDANPKSIRSSILRYLENPDIILSTKNQLAKLHDLLGKFPASETAGNVILSDLKLLS